MTESIAARIESEYILKDQERVYLSLFQIAGRRYAEDRPAEEQVSVQLNEARGKSSVLHIKIGRLVFGELPRTEVGREAELMKNDVDTLVNGLIHSHGFAERFGAGVTPSTDSPDRE